MARSLRSTSSISMKICRKLTQTAQINPKRTFSSDEACLSSATTTTCLTRLERCSFPPAWESSVTSSSPSPSSSSTSPTPPKRTSPPSRRTTPTPSIGRTSPGSPSSGSRALTRPNYYAEGGVDRVSRSAAESTGEESGANSGRLPSARLARSGSSRLLFVSQYVPFPSFRLKTRPEGETGNKLTFPLPPRNRRLSPPFHSASQ
jgi:hypothetical protein